MSQLISITNRNQLNSLLLTLEAGTVPLWGKMKSQQMVEHLVNEVEYTNGKKAAGCDRPPEEANKDKAVMIYTDAQIPKNVILEPLPENYRYASLEIAIKQLMRELDDFDEYFKEPGITSIHFGFGAMNHQEWLIWHGKHFTHHFKQFGLLPNE